MEARYQSNIGELFSEELQKDLLTKKVAVMGCGGQGGYILECLARLGVKELTFWDGDKFDETNLNRQLGCTLNTVGQNKAIAWKERIKIINPSINLHCCDWYFGEKKTSDLILALHQDIIINAADATHFGEELRSYLRELILSGIPVIDCPTGILGGSVTIETKDTVEHFDFQTQIYLSVDRSLPNPNSRTAYKCAIVAGEAINQMVQYFNNCRFASVGSTLEIDIYHHRYNQFDKFGEF